MVNYSRFIKEAMVLMDKPSVIGSPLDEISRVQKVEAVEKWFRGSLGCFGSIRVYIGKGTRLGDP